MSNRTARDAWILPTLQGLLSPDGAAQLQSAAGESYWEAAVQRRLLGDEEILTAVASRFRLPIANLAIVSPQARDAVPEQLARKHRIVPLAITDSTLEIATAEPHDLDCERALGFATGRSVRLALASPLAIAERIEELYRPESVIDRLLDSVTSEHEFQSSATADEPDEIAASAHRASERPVIRLVDHVLAEGISSRASDIHLEAGEHGVVVRYRIDGVLRDAMTLPRGVGLPLVSRIKIMSGLDIADRLRPQDGRAMVTMNGSRVDLRVSTLPASRGEKVVVRILDNRATIVSMDSMGLNPDEAARIAQLLGTREGLVLVTGPTGSGKTTTLYSLLRQIQNRGGLNIVTVEDPVEYQLQGIVQVQVHEKAGLTFAAALRSILRQDPDVVLVGEIRDEETAKIATQASLTGHLVFSTLHTIDAASSVTRLADIGVEPYKIAAALKGIIAQRLLRRLCTSCRELHLGAPPERLQRWIPMGAPLYRPTGCSDCSMTGYRGRFAITEVLVTSAEVERRIAAGEASDRVADAAREVGMRSLWESGLAHVRAGETSLEELLRVVDIPADRGRVSGPQVAVPRAAADAAHGPQYVSGGHPAIPTSDQPAHLSPARLTPRANLTVPLPGSDAFQLLEEPPALATESDGKRTILLVEDEANLRRVLKDILERDGFRVVEAADGVEALDQVDRSAPDAVVLDIDLPRLDGHGVLRYLRTRPATMLLPVLVLTAMGDEESEVRIFESGATDYISKPLRARSLAPRLRSLLQRV